MTVRRRREVLEGARLKRNRERRAREERRVILYSSTSSKN